MCALVFVGLPLNSLVVCWVECYCGLTNHLYIRLGQTAHPATLRCGQNTHKTFGDVFSEFLKIGPFSLGLYLMWLLFSVDFSAKTNSPCYWWLRRHTIGQLEELLNKWYIDHG